METKTRWGESPREPKSESPGDAKSSRSFRVLIWAREDSLPTDEITVGNVGFILHHALKELAKHIKTAGGKA